MLHKMPSPPNETLPGADQSPDLQTQELVLPWLLSLEEVEGHALPLVGGKAFRLAVLKRHGFQVPPGLVLTTHFFETQLKQAKLMPLWAGTPDIAVTAEALTWLSDALKLKPLSRVLAEALQAQLEALFPEVETFAVRSSVIDEDQRDHTFAGIHLTELRVPRTALPIAITRCWASALSEPAVKYRQVHGMSIQGIRIAVLIQPMLSPQSSGVGFTLDPLSGSRDEFVIEAVWGLGQALVSGEVQPYFYRLANQPPDYPLLEQRAGAPPTPEVQPESPLAPVEITELAQQLGQIQALLGEAQDIEWARQAGTFFILQSRPVTVLPEPPSAVDQEWARSYQAGPLPELPSPFFGSLLERSQAEALRFFKEMGGKLDKLGPYEKLILGRPYLNLTLLRRLVNQMGINPASFLQTIGYASPKAAQRLLSVDWKIAWTNRQLYRAALNQLRQPGRYLREAENLLAEINPPLAGTSQPSGAALWRQLSQLSKLFNSLGLAQLSLLLNIAGLTGSGAWLVASASRNPNALIKALALQDLKTEAAELHEALAELAASCDDQVKQCLLAAEDFTNYTQNSCLSGAFKQNFEAVLSRYGHRATYEADPACPRYAEDPAPLLQLLKHILEKNAAGQPPADAEPPALLPPWQRWLIKPLVNSLHRLLLLREALDSLKARANALCRQWGLAVGQTWAAAGWLETPEDIFWLTWEEIERTLIAQSGVAITLSSTVRARQEVYASYSRIQMPFFLRDSQIPTLQFGLGSMVAGELDVITGLPISPGQARGTIIVIHQPSDFKKPVEDVILVMSSTDPAWLALLHQAAGLIVETGGLLSHGSVIAREYGLPAVANIPDATRRFHTGDKVLLDGSTGIVQLLETGPPSAEKANIQQET
jgi:rifampicin phosphotransferase